MQEPDDWLSEVPASAVKVFTVQTTSVKVRGSCGDPVSPLSDTR